MWTKLVEELEPIGFVLHTVHSEHERELARYIFCQRMIRQSGFFNFFCVCEQNKFELSIMEIKKVL